MIWDHIGDDFDPTQYGGLKNLSTTHALIDTLHKWHTAIAAGETVRVVFVDFSKAFDLVCHHKVLEKLNATTPALPSHLLNWMRSFLAERRQQVRVGDSLSEWSTLKVGMPQGTWNGARIFIFYEHDCTPQCWCHKYIDDTTLSESFVSSEDSNIFCNLGTAYACFYQL